MKNFMKGLEKIMEYKKFLRNIFVLVILTRLLFLEPNQLALIAEIVGGVAVNMTKDPEDICD